MGVATGLYISYGQRKAISMGIENQAVKHGYTPVYHPYNHVNQCVTGEKQGTTGTTGTTGTSFNQPNPKFKYRVDYQ